MGPIFALAMSSLLTYEGSLNILNMIAPIKVMSLPLGLRNVAVKELEFLMGLEPKPSDDKNLLLFELAGTSYTEALRKRWEARDELIAAMRSHLEP